MPPRVRIAAAAVVALGALAGIVALVVHIRSDESGVGRLHFAATSPAGAPFGEFDQTRVGLGSRCLRVLVALSPAQRTQGLRDVRSLAPYAGMLFVNPSLTTARFTMAGTPMPLEVIFFAADGAPVDDKKMEPCPQGSDATCPEYASRAPYRYALEQPTASAAASGTLGACAA